ncbi:LPS-assembly lipoprotein LptE [Modicisalibacter radicis]|uniref:LPS-assembly lipoprotein LptE n=1 Tax=Halomonas sp. EAR18 TaxID=2518972 RepID=UPI00109C85EA|nr:LPS assembly lipoprotein LptE [Halomonas sp. EAR18]
MKRRTFLTRSLSVALLGAGIAALPGCGFHLRDTGASQDVGIDSLALAATPSALGDSVGRALRDAGIELSDAAALRLNLGTERIQEIDLSAGGSGTREIELQLEVPFSVQRTGDDAYLLDQQRVAVATTFRANDNELLTQDDDRERALESLRRDAAQRLLDRLRNLDASR